MINNNLLIYIYTKKINLIEELEFKKLVFSFGIKYKKYIKIHVRFPNKKYFFGIGKIKELKDNIIKHNIFQIVISRSLKSIQEYNLKKVLNCFLLNKTNLILSIFNKRATTNYGKLQVKLSYLNYLSTRLINKWTHLERQRGGVKFISGPGEKQIEIDRRIIKKKINYIKLCLKKNNLNKNRRKKLRDKYNIPIISLVGYTNSGKSTLFNLLTDSKVICENKYFSTLDTYIRKIKIFNFYYDILLSDTIGFIKYLPKNIISGFKGTLDEINNSKLIFHVVDVSNIYYINNINIVNNILLNINIFNIPIVLIMNKIDKLNDFSSKIDYNNNNIPYRIWISSKKKIGINYINDIIKFYFFNDLINFIICISINFVYLIKKYIYKNNIIILKEWSLDGKEYFINIIIKKIYINIFIKKYPFVKFLK